ncbi:MAG: hypothetical protein R2792_12465 [Saprospiraceae bacterium]
MLKETPARTFIFLGIVLVSLGVTASTVFKEHTSSLGTVLIAVGGLAFLIGMQRKQTEEGGK